MNHTPPRDRSRMTPAQAEAVEGPIGAFISSWQVTAGGVLLQRRVTESHDHNTVITRAAEVEDEFGFEHGSLEIGQ